MEEESKHLKATAGIVARVKAWSGPAVVEDLDRGPKRRKEKE